MKEYTALFFYGITMGLGPCLTFCSPILLPYITARNKENWLGGVRDILIFSLARVTVYSLLGLAAGSIGFGLTAVIAGDRFIFLKYLGMGIFILLLGIVMVLGRTKFTFCRILHRETIERSTKSMILLGILTGFSPCLPLAGALGIIAGLAPGSLAGAFWGFSFGLGTVVSPLILLALAAGGVGRLFSLKPALHRALRGVCGSFLIYFGIRLIWRVL
jgi:sulfite exporter TauE/SafE